MSKIEANGVVVARLILFAICLAFLAGCMNSTPIDPSNRDFKGDNDDDNDDNDDVDAGADTDVDTDTDADADTDDDKDSDTGTDTGAYKKMWNCLICE